MTETDKKLTVPGSVPVDAKKLIDGLGTIFGDVIQLLAAMEPGMAKELADMLNYTPIRTMTYEGSLEDWAAVTKLSGWDGNSGDLHGLTKVQCLDGYMEYDSENREWKEVRE